MLPKIPGLYIPILISTITNEEETNQEQPFAPFRKTCEDCYDCRGCTLGRIAMEESMANENPYYHKRMENYKKEHYDKWRDSLPDITGCEMCCPQYSDIEYKYPKTFDKSKRYVEYGKDCDDCGATYISNCYLPPDEGDSYELREVIGKWLYYRKYGPEKEDPYYHK